MRVCVFDLASLRFSRTSDRGTARVRTAAGELLASTRGGAALTDRQVAAALCDQALAGARVIRSVDGCDEAVPVGFYNPFSAEVAIGALPATAAYSDGRAVPLAVDGTVAALDGDRLHLAGRLLDRLELDADVVSRALAAHPDPD
jgi:hypothetical protein